jgi:Xaa-Pro dipeptidase
MDFPMLYRGNEVELSAGMVFFTHMILMDSDLGAAFCLGRTYIIGEKMPESVSKYPLTMIVR